MGIRRELFPLLFIIHFRLISLCSYLSGLALKVEEVMGTIKGAKVNNKLFL